MPITEAAFADLSFDPPDERRAASVLAEARARLAIADERDRIARDLHDTVIQRLFATGLCLQGALGRTDIASEVEKSLESIDDAIREIRTSIFHLRRPARLVALSDSVRATVEEARRMLGCALVVELDNSLDDLVAENLCEDLLTVVRECLMNIVKHACASRVGMGIHIEANRLVVRIDDDGVGFSPSGVTGGHGLRNLRERVEQSRGSCEVTSSPGNGTHLVVSMPLPCSPSLHSEPSRSFGFGCSAIG